MSVFRLSENVPKVYVDESRDFHLLCNLFDSLQNSIKYDIDTMLNVADTSKCPEAYIPFLQSKLGFISQNKYSTTTLRIVLQLFPLLIRWKGSKEGVYTAILVYRRAKHVHCDISVVFDNTDYSILVSINTVELLDISLLKDLLNYVVPAGYKLKYQFYAKEAPTDKLSVRNTTSYNTIALMSDSIVYNDTAEQSSDSNGGTLVQYDLWGVGTTHITLNTEGDVSE